jgi:hypothetical protein
MNTPYERSRGNPLYRRYLALAVWLLVPTLCACEAESKHDVGQQVIAKVNGDDIITVRELTDQFARIQTHFVMDTKIGKKQVLDSLVDEKLLVQRAIDIGLDRKPETIVALDRARRHVLAQASIEQATQGASVEMLPPAVLAQASRMQGGDILMSREGGRTIYMQLVSTIAEPVEIARATPAIRAYLAEGRRKRTAKTLLRDLRNDARIEYSQGLIDGINVQVNARPSEAALGASFRTEVARTATVGRPK